MPAVVPRLSSRNCSLVSELNADPSALVPPLGIMCSAIPTAMTTRLLATGAQAGTPNFSLVFRIAPNSAAIP